MNLEVQLIEIFNDSQEVTFDTSNGINDMRKLLESLSKYDNKVESKLISKIASNKY